jgi:hypothetical protein
MSDEHGDEVTAQVVDRLWVEAIEGSTAADEIHNRVEALLNRVNAESPVVNWGMTTLHALTRTPARPRDELIEAQNAWVSEVERYQADPKSWQRRYFVDMVRDFTERKGANAGRAFATKLIRDGHIGELDLPAELRS